MTTDSSTPSVSSTSTTPPTAPTTTAGKGSSPTTTPVPFRGCGWHLSVGIRPGESTPALVAAVFEGDTDQVRELLSSGSTPDVIDTWQVTTPLLAALAANCEPMVVLLLTGGASPDLVPHGAETALVHAVNTGEIELVELLIEFGADPSQGGYDMPSALHQASIPERLALLEAMVPFASDIDVGLMAEFPLRSGEDIGLGSPVEFAADTGCIECIDILAEGGAQLTVTSVYRGIRAGDQQVVERLLDLGVDLGPADGEDRQLLTDFAESRGLTEIARRIKEWSK